MGSDQTGRTFVVTENTEAVVKLWARRRSTHSGSDRKTPFAAPSGGLAGAPGPGRPPPRAILVEAARWLRYLAARALPTEAQARSQAEGLGPEK